MPPLGVVEVWLAAIWRDVLGIGDIARHDDFFALGGASLDAMRLVARIEEQAGVRVPLAVVFDHATLAELARRLSEMGAGAASSR